MLMKIYALLALSSLPVISATAAEIVVDLQDLTNKWEAVSDALAVSSVTLAAALTAHKDLGLVGTATNTATTAVVNTGPFSVADGLEILPVFQNLCSTVVSAATSKLISDKPALEALPLGGVPALLVQDLTTINTATDNLAGDLVANAPVSQRNDFQTAASGCEQAVHACLVAYST